MTEKDKRRRERKAREQRTPRALVESLEPRILMSADVPALLATEAPAAVEWVVGDDTNALHAQAEEMRRELIFVDAGVEDHAQLVADLKAAGGAETQFQVVLLDASTDGLAQISEVLGSGEESWDAVHIVSHGNEEGIQLGSSFLTQASLSNRAGEITGWQTAFSKDADLLLYGCDLASSEQGRGLVDDLAILTGADVAASDDATGAAALGGDWQLEYQSGELETAIAFSQQLQSDFVGIFGGTAIWSEAGSNTPESSDFDGTSFGPELSTADLGGAFTVMAGAEAPTRDEKIVVGVREDGKLNAMIWDGTSWTQNDPAFFPLGTVSNTDTWNFDVVYESQSGDALLVYNNGFDLVGFSRWNGSNWSFPGAVPQAVSGEDVQIKLAANPNSDEIIAVISTENNQTYASVWNGDAWSSTTYHFPGGDTAVDATDANIVYEQQSGNAMVVYGYSGTEVIYQVWDGTDFTGGVLTEPPSIQGSARFTDLAADPNTDRIALGVSTDDHEGWAAVWNGASWDTPETLSNNLSHKDRQNVAVAFESQSGNAIAAYAHDSSAVSFSEWDSGSGWSGRQTGAALPHHMDSLTLDADPHSDSIMLSTLLSGKDVAFVHWDGDGWGTATVQETDSPTNKAQPFLFLWDLNEAPAAPDNAHLYFATETDVTSSGAPGLQDWADGDLLQFSNPGLQLGPNTSGEISRAFDLNSFAQDGDAQIDGMHVVGRALDFGTVNPISLLAGDLLISTGASEVLGGVAVNDGDLVVFRPDAWDDYNSGSFFLLATGLANGQLEDIALVETPVTVGSESLSAGTLLFTEDGSAQIQRWNPVDPLGGGVVSAPLAVASSLNLSGGTEPRGLELIQSTRTVGGVTLNPGDLLVSIEDGATIGSNSLAVTRNDIVRLQTDSGGIVTASIFFDGSDVNLSGTPEAVRPIAMVDFNTAPVLTAASPTLTPITEDELANAGDQVSSILGGSVADAETGSTAGIAVTGLVESQGSWEFSIDGGTVWTTVAGVTDSNALLLRSTDRIRFVPDGLTADSASFDFRAWDQAGGTPGTYNDVSTNGGSTPFSSDSDTASILVSGVNDAPSGTDQTLSLDEDVAYAFSAADFGFTDLAEGDSFAGIVVSGLTGGGVLRNGAQVLVGGETVTAAEIAASQLVFTPAADAHGPGHATFLFQVMDDGGTANGGIDTDATANTLTLDVQSVNDAPIGTAGTINAVEDTPYALTAADFGFTDAADGDAFVGVLITTAPGAGQLVNGAVVITDGTFVSALDIVGGNLRFTAAPDASGAGYTSFTFQVQDDGGTANGGIDLDATARTMGVNVTGVNDAPAGADATLTTLEDTAYTLQLADFGFTDALDGDSLAAIVISGTSGSGTLRNGSTVLTGGETVTAAQIAGGALVYTPAADVNGTGVGGFTFQVQDDGGTANLGIDLDPTPNSVQFDVTAVNDAPVGADQRVTTDEDTAYTFTVADFGFTDTADGDALQSVRIGTLSGRGVLRDGSTVLTGGETVSLASITGGQLTFTPIADESGVSYGGFMFQVQDDGGTANGGSDLDGTPRAMLVDVTSTNDAPSGSDTTLTLLEDTTHTFALADFGFSDPSDGDNLQAIVIGTLSGGGVLRDGATVLTGGETVSALSIAGGSLTFTPAADANGVGYGGFSFQVQDDGGTAGSGVDLDPTPNQITFDVTAVNDEPSGTDGTVTTGEDTAYQFTISDFGLTDTADGDSLQAVRIGTIAGGGTLRNGSTVLTGGETVLASDISMNALTFTPGAGENGAGYASFTFQVEDDGGTLNGGVALDSTPNTLTVDVSAVNNAPAGVDSQVTAIEDTPYTFAVTDFGFTDAEGHALSAIEIGTVGGLGTLRNGSTVLTGGETVTAAEIAGGSLTFTPAANASGLNHCNFTFQVRDTGGTANGGSDLDPVANLMTVDVTAVNDEPMGADGTVTSLEDTAYIVTAADFGFSDVVDGDGFAGVTISTAPGVGVLRDGARVLVDGDFVSAASIAANQLVFTPAADANGPTYSGFGFQVHDDGGTANGGVEIDSTANWLTVAITPVNDAPSGTDRAISILEDTTHTFSVGEFGFSDAAEGDSFHGIVIGTLSGGGTLRHGATVLTGGEFVSAADIGLGQLTFQPGGDAAGANYAGFDFQVQDDGGTLNTGIDLDPTSNAITLNVTPVNDAPLASGQTVSVLEDGSRTFSALDFGFSDPTDGDGFHSVVIGTISGTGTLTKGGTALTGGETVTAAELASGQLVYTPAANVNGLAQASFDFQVRDDGGTANGGMDLSATHQMVLDVTPVNDAPMGAGNTVTVLEDGTLTFSAADFGFSDALDGDGFAGIVVGAVNGGGTLRNGATILTGGETVTAAQIAGGALTFQPTSNSSGANHGSFSFAVMDDGGTANGGVDTDTTTRLMTIDVTGVNDAPAGADGVITTLEDTAYAFDVTDFGFSDAADGDGFAGIVFQAVTGGGTVRNAATVLTGGEFVSAAQILSGQLTLTPPSNLAGNAVGSFSFQVKDDGGSLNGGSDIDPTANVLSLNVTAVNDAPQGSDNTLTILEDTTRTLVAGDFGFSDAVDGHGLAAIRIGSVSGGGVLQNGATTLTGGETVTLADLTAGRLTFTPGSDAHGTGHGSFTFQVQDDGGTANGGVDLDPVLRTLQFDVTAVNDAPSGSDTTILIDEGVPQTLSFLNFGFSDPESDGFANLVITSVAGTGVLADGATVLSGGETVSLASLLAGNLVYSPAVGISGAAAAVIGFQVQDDGGTANGGVDLDPTVRFLTIDISGVNDAPVLTPAAPNLPTLNEDAVNNTGERVSTIVAGSISDLDAGASEGIAMTRVSAGPGSWQYSVDGGTTWLNVGIVDQTNALLLRDVDRLRFVPDGQNGGTASLDYRAWDQTQGAAATKLDASSVGGSTAFSVAEDTASVSITSVNDAPTLGNATLTSAPGDVQGATVASLFGGSFSDVDAGSSLSGIVVVANAAAPAQGVWEYSSDGGANWAQVAAVSDGTSALALSSASRLRFNPASGFSGTPTPLSVRALDNTYGGAFSSTAGGAESRVNLNSTANGGASPISASMSSLNSSQVEAEPPVIEPGVEDEPSPEGSLDEVEPDGDVEEETEEDAAEDEEAATESADSASELSPVSLGLIDRGNLAAASWSYTPSEARFSTPSTVQLEESRTEQSAEQRNSNELRTAGFGSLPTQDLQRLLEAASAELGFFQQDSGFASELDGLRDVVLDQNTLEQAAVGSSVALSAGLSIGYVVWLTRGGLLIASMASSIPVWRLVDPIPILASLAFLDDEEEDEESLDSMLETDEQPDDATSEALT